jgi:hypothetical protein
MKPFRINTSEADYIKVTYAKNICKPSWSIRQFDIPLFIGCVLNHSKQNVNKQENKGTEIYSSPKLRNKY